MSEQFRVLEDLKYDTDGRVVIPKGSIVEIKDDFPFYSIECPKLKEEELRREKEYEGYYEDFDNYGMSVHMSEVKSREELPWSNKLELI